MPWKPPVYRPPNVPTPEQRKRERDRQYERSRIYKTALDRGLGQRVTLWDSPMWL